jgi:hemoglobin
MGKLFLPGYTTKSGRVGVQPMPVVGGSHYYTWKCPWSQWHGARAGANSWRVTLFDNQTEVHMFNPELKYLKLFCLSAFILAGSPGALAQSDAPVPSLFDRLGGLAPISVVVNDFIDVVVADSVLNANEAVEASRNMVPAPYLKYQVTAMVCEVTGGPCSYQGRDMKTAHAHLNITAAEWDQMVMLFKDVLAKHQVPEGETQELLDIVGSTQADIVMAP